jgi:uncharacterized membrane protein YozB (DUF420 family)
MTFVLAVLATHQLSLTGQNSQFKTVFSLRDISQTLYAFVLAVHFALRPWYFALQATYQLSLTGQNSQFKTMFSLRDISQTLYAFVLAVHFALRPSSYPPAVPNGTKQPVQNCVFSSRYRPGVVHYCFGFLLPASPLVLRTSKGCSLLFTH